MDRWRLLRWVSIPVVILAGGLLATGQDARAAASLSHNNTLTHNSVTLTLSGHTGGWTWQYSSAGPDVQLPGLPSHEQDGITTICRSVSDSTLSLTLTPNTGPINLAAFATNNCGPTSIAIADISFTSPAAPPVTLSVVDGTVTDKRMNLTIANHTGNWHYKHNQTGASCVSAGTETTVTATGLTANTSYIFKAYSDNTCNTELATAAASLTTPGRVSKAYLAEGPNYIRFWWQTPTGATKVNIQRTEIKGNWDSAVTVESDASLGVAISNGLGNGITYYFRLRFKSDTSDLGPPVILKGTPGPVAFDATTVTQTGATLTLSKYDGWGNLRYSDPLPELENRKLPIEGEATTNWSYKQTSPSSSECISVPKANGTTATVSGLNSGTTYTFQAYKNLDCTSLLGDPVTFKTATPPTSTAPWTGLSAAAITETTATLAIDNYGGSWYYKRTQPTEGDHPYGTCSAVVTGTSVNLTGLRADTSYTFMAYQDQDCTMPIALYSFTTLAPDPAVNLSTSSLTLTEGTTDSYTVVLNSQPTDTVTVALESSDATVATVSPTTLSFNSSNWDQTQNVTVTGLDNAVDGQDRAITISHNPSGGDYDAVADVPLAVSVTDDDARGVSLSTSSLTLTEGTTDTYTVRLDSQPTDTVTVALESSDTTVATVSPTTLSFNSSNWDQTQNVTVTGTKDADTQDAVITIRHDPSGGDYGGLSGPQLTVMVEDLGPLVSQRVNQVVQDVTPHLNRAVTAHTTHAVAQRVAQVSQGALPLDTSRISWGNLPTTAQDAMALARRWTEGETISVAALLDNTSFNTSFSPQGQGTATAIADGNSSSSPWGVWGVVDYGQIASGEDQSTTDWDAALLSALLGADRMVNDHLLAGAALAWSSSSFDYQTRSSGELAAGKGEGRLQLFSVHPYLGWRLDGGKSLWTSVGYGWGDLTIDDAATARDTSTDLTQWSLAAGASGILYQSSSSGEPAAATNQLLWKTDAWFSSLQVAGNDLLKDDQQQAYRLRLGVEGNRSISLDNHSLLTPSLGLFYRYEGGDGATGSGLDLAAALRYDNPNGLQLEGRGRTLLLHSEGLKDWGISGLLRFSPRGNDGFSLSLSPKWGRTDSPGLQQLWSNHQDQLSTTGDVSSALLLDAELRSPKLTMGSYSLTPALGFQLSPDTWTTRLGTALQLHDSLNLQLHLSRQQPDEGHTHHALGLNLHMDF